MALKWLRDQFKHLKIILWAVVAVFVLLVFVDWGAGRSGDGGRADDVAVRVGNVTVSEQEFVNELRRNQQRFQQVYGDQWEQIRDSIDLGSQTVQFLVERQILLAEVERVGLVVSARELQDEILSYPAFQKESGGFVGGETYERILIANRTTPQEFEQRLAEDLLLRKLNAMMEQGVYVTDAEVVESFRREREFSDFDAIQLRYERFLSEVTVDDAELQAHFDAHADDYRRAEERVIRYLLVETAKLRRLLEVDDSTLETYYQDHQDEFMTGEQAKASHILFRVAPGSDEVERAGAELEAEQVAKMARSGIDFAELATKHSDDPVSKENGGDLGWFGRGRMVEEFDEAVFNAKPGDILGPVKSQFGYHVIKVEAYQPERVQSFEEVKEQVKFRYLEGQAAAESETRAMALSRRVAAGVENSDEAWQSVADEDESVVLNLSPPVAASEVIPGTGDDLGLVAEVFDSTLGRVAGPRATPRGWIVWQLAEIRPAGIPPFAEVRGEVEQQLRRDKALDVAAERAEEVLAAWRAGGDAEALAQEVGASVIAVRDHRRGTAIGAIGLLPAVDDAVFSSAEGELVGPIRAGDRGVVVARVERLILADEAELELEREAIRSRLMRERANRLLASVINERRRETVVTVNNELLERFAPRS